MPLEKANYEAKKSSQESLKGEPAKRRKITDVVAKLLTEEEVKNQDEKLKESQWKDVQKFRSIETRLLGFAKDQKDKITYKDKTIGIQSEIAIGRFGARTSKVELIVNKNNPGKSPEAVRGIRITLTENSKTRSPQIVLETIYNDGRNVAVSIAEIAKNDPQAGLGMERVDGENYKMALEYGLKYTDIIFDKEEEKEYMEKDRQAKKQAALKKEVTKNF